VELLRKWQNGLKLKGYRDCKKSLDHQKNLKNFKKTLDKINEK
jgi:hypothetical protein